MCDPRTLEPLDNVLFNRTKLNCVAFAPGSTNVAVGGSASTIYVLSCTPSGSLGEKQAAVGHRSEIRRLVWSDTDTLVSGTDSGSIGIWVESSVDNQLRSFLHGPEGRTAHGGAVRDLAWSARIGLLASAGADGKVRLWDLKASRALRRTLNMDEPALAVEFSLDGRVLVARTLDKIRFIKTDQMEEMFSFEHLADARYGYLVISTKSGLVATEDSRKQCIDVWEVDFDALIKLFGVTRRRYSNAKVVIFGERNSGKSNLALALSDKQFREANADHGVEVHRLPLDDVISEDGKCLSREIAIWDLPNYNRYDLIQRLHLGNTAATLLVFDSRLYTAHPNLGQHDSLANVRKQAMDPSLSGARFLVATKADRTELPDNHSQLTELRSYFQGMSVFVTSAKGGTGIDKLLQAICKSIDWSAHPVCDPAETFRELEDFIRLEKNAGTIFAARNTLYSLFTAKSPHLRSHELFGAFTASLELLDNLGLVYKFSLGDQILLEPKYVHLYAAALVDAAGRDRHGMGRLPVDEAHTGNGAQFQLTEQARIPESKQESLLLEVIIRELLRAELIYEVSTNENSYLVFPSQPTRQLDPIPTEDTRAARGSFEGHEQDIYSSLVVRLLGLQILFSNPELYHNAAVFRARTGGACGLLLDAAEDGGSGEIGVFFDENADQPTRETFLKFVKDHINERARPQTLKWDVIPDSSLVLSGRSSASHAGINVFFSYEAGDFANVAQIAQELRKKQISPWLDNEKLLGGDPPDKRRQARARHRIAVVALSRKILSTLQLDDCADLRTRNCRVIPIILPGTSANFEIPDILRNYTPVDFRILGQQSYDRLIDGIMASVASGADEPIAPRHVFLSYCREDRDAAEALRLELLNEGLTVWWDQEIRAGEEWKISIYSAIKRAYAVLVCFSEKASQRTELGMYPEIATALEFFGRLAPNSVYLLPVRLSSCDLPPMRLDSVRWLHDIQTIDLFSSNRQQQFGRLVDALKAARDRFARSA